MDDKCDFKLLACLVGEQKVGKASIKKQFTAKPNKSIASENRVLTIEGIRVCVTLENINGDQKSANLPSSSLLILLVYDVTLHSSFDQIKVWLQFVNANVKKGATIVLIGNKIESIDKRIVPFHVAESFARENGLAYLEISAKSPSNVEQVFFDCTRLILTKIFAGDLNWRDVQLRSSELTIYKYKTLRANFLDTIAKSLSISTSTTTTSSASSSSSYTPLGLSSSFPNYAPSSNHLRSNSFIQVLLKTCNPNQPDQEKRTPLHILCEEGNYDLALMFILDGWKVDVNVADQNQQTPLHYACASGNARLVDLLIQSGALVDVKDLDDRTPLFYAIVFRHIEIVKMLTTIEKPDLDIKDQFGKTLLHYAVSSGYVEMVSLLMSMYDIKGFEVDKRNLLHYATSIEMLKFLLAKGANVNTFNRYRRTLLHKFAESGNLDLVKFLLDSGARFDIRDLHGNTHLPIDYAIINRHTEIAKLLVNVNNLNNLDTDGKTLLHKAVQSGNADLVQYLLERGARLNVKDNTGHFPIYYAVHNNYNEIVKLLINRENINNLNEGKTVLHYYTQHGNLEMVRYLLRNGARPDIKDNDGNQPIYYAIQNHYTEIIKILINKDNINNVDCFGRTLLHYSAQNGNIDLVKFLIHSDARHDIKDDDGKVAKYYAKKNGHTDIVKLLSKDDCVIM